MSVTDARAELTKAGICKQADWKTANREMSESLKAIKEEKPVNYDKKSQLALKAWKQREEAAKLKFITEAFFSSQRTAGVSAKRAGNMIRRFAQT